MRLQWAGAALGDLRRFETFLAQVNRNAAKRAISAIRANARRTLEHPQIGERVEEITSREIRKLLIDQYELRYEVLPNLIRVLRVFHMREDR
ncbi:plasmid stabilization protein [Devosia sp. Root105]|nr:plasmid stabilization protein [Devosia sp. Root105]